MMALVPSVQTILAPDEDCTTEHEVPLRPVAPFRPLWIVTEEPSLQLMMPPPTVWETEQEVPLRPLLMLAKEPSVQPTRAPLVV